MFAKGFKDGELENKAAALMNCKTGGTVLVGCELLKGKDGE